MTKDEAQGGARSLVAAYKLSGLEMAEIAYVLSFAFAEVVDDPDTRPETLFAIARVLGLKPQ